MTRIVNAPFVIVFFCCVHHLDSQTVLCLSTMLIHGRWFAFIMVIVGSCWICWKVFLFKKVLLLTRKYQKAQLSLMIYVVFIFIYKYVPLPFCLIVFFVAFIGLETIIQTKQKTLLTIFMYILFQKRFGFGYQFFKQSIIVVGTWLIKFDVVFYTYLTICIFAGQWLTLMELIDG